MKEWNEESIEEHRRKSLNVCEHLDSRYLKPSENEAAAQYSEIISINAKCTDWMMLAVVCRQPIKSSRPLTTSHLFAVRKWHSWRRKIEFIKCKNKGRETHAQQQTAWQKGEKYGSFRIVNMKSHFLPLDISYTLYGNKEYSLVLLDNKELCIRYITHIFTRILHATHSISTSWHRKSHRGINFPTSVSFLSSRPHYAAIFSSVLFAFIRAESAAKKQQELHREKSLFNVCFHLRVAVSASRCCLSPRLINFNPTRKSRFSRAI